VRPVGGSSDPSVAVVTVVRGRHEHLRAQLAGLAAGRRRPQLHVLVSMDDPQVGEIAGGYDLTVPVAVPVPVPNELPLAAARNHGAQVALSAGADLLVFLDVDCIPSTRMLERYVAAALDSRHWDSLLCGPVAYLPDPGSDGYRLDELATLATPHPARPDPPSGQVVQAEDRRLFWSLSFAATATTWRRVGGFCEQYVGYGGEDTDYVETAARAGVGMRWVGGATAFHQYHQVSSPPVEHRDAILRNARLFHRRWGWWPMTGWLDAFADRGLAAYSPSQGWVARDDVPQPVPR
jgi:GT2 family glycosyltransferase